MTELKLSRKKRRGLRIVEAKTSAKRNKTWTGIWGMWLLTNILSSLPKSLIDFIPQMQKLYYYAGHLQPPSGSGIFWRFAYANLLFWPLAGCALLLRNLGYILFRKEKKQVVAQDPVILYKDELATAIMAIDMGDKAGVDNSIGELLLLVAETVAVNLGLRKKDFRMYFIVPIPKDPQKKTGDVKDKDDEEDEILLSALRFGKVFDSNGTLSENELATILKLDETRVKGFLAEDESNKAKPAKTESYVGLHTSEDATVLMMSRNPGLALRMGLYVAVTAKDAKVDDFKEVFPQVAQIVSTLGFIDTIVDYVRNYGEERGDRSESEEQ